MNYKIVNIRTTSNVDPEQSLLIIYTGGTMGMVFDEHGSLKPFNFNNIKDRIPELSQFELKITVISFQDPIDSSSISPTEWGDLVFIIKDNYEKYDAFVILHGTDTMAYTASALSFMLDGLTKPVILTGAQIPIGQIRSDARENLLTAIEIASATDENGAIVKEVCIYFNYVLLRGNRSQKMKSSTFAAFETPNYPPLAESGIMIEYNHSYLYDPAPMPLKVKSKFELNVVTLRLFPGITEHVVQSILNTRDLTGVVLETYGSGNTTNSKWFHNCLSEAIKKGIIILNVSQCSGGEVIQGRYESSKKLQDIGVLSGGDLTIEAALTKLMFLLGNERSKNRVKELLTIPLRGEMDF